MSVETLNHSAQAEQSAQAPETLNERLHLLDAKFDAHYVPTMEALVEAGSAVAGVRPLSETEYCDDGGTPVDTDVAQRMAVKANPDTWLLSDDEVDAAEHLQDAKEASEVTGALGLEFVEKYSDSGKTPDEALGDFKKYMSKRLKLSEEITDIKEAQSNPKTTEPKESTKSTHVIEHDSKATKENERVRPVSKEVVKKSKVEVVPTTKEEANYPGGLTEKQWNSLSPVEKARIEAKVAKEAYENAPAGSDKRRTAYFNLYNAEKALKKAERGHKVHATKDRLRNIVPGGAASVTTRMNKVSEYYADKERGDKRLLTTVAILGGVAVAAAVAYKYGLLNFNGGRAAEHLQQPPHDVAGKREALAELHKKPLGEMNTGHSVAQAHESFKVLHGDHPYNVLERAGISPENIIASLEHAGRAAHHAGHEVQWHGSGTHRWIEVDGKSDTTSVMNVLGKYIKR